MCRMSSPHRTHRTPGPHRAPGSLGSRAQYRTKCRTPSPPSASGAHRAPGSLCALGVINLPKHLAVRFASTPCMHRTDAAHLVRNFISKLPVEKPLIRYNWTVLPTRELHLSRWVRDQVG